MKKSAGWRRGDSWDKPGVGVGTAGVGTAVGLGSKVGVGTGVEVGGSGVGVGKRELICPGVPPRGPEPQLAGS